MNNYYRFWLSLLVFFFALATEMRSEVLISSDKLLINGQVRFRTELDKKNFTPNTGLNNFHLLRSRLGLKITPAENIVVFLQFQYSRTFGMETSTIVSQSNIDLHQGYFRLDNIFGINNLTLQVGRMEIIFGGGRLFSSCDWSNVGRSFDGARLFFDKNPIRAEIWAAKVKKLFDKTLGEDKDHNILGCELEIGRKPEFTPRSYYFLERNNDKNSIGLCKLSRHTIGAQILGKKGSLNYDLEVAFQTGNYENQDIRAYLIAFSAGYSLHNKTKTRLSIGYDFLSGNDGSMTYKAFNTPYAGCHKFYGYMDLFTKHVQIGGLGLKDYMIKVQHNFHPKVRGNTDFHLFYYAEDDAFGQNAVGKELDLTFSLNVRTSLLTTIGASVFFPDEAFELTKGEETAYWLYCMMTVNF